tara:strand:+ start:6266 stop:7312 length:1047 start_codon:yes stop_codon:yes gene_type:complete
VRNIENIIVTGASGFIGSNFIKNLLEDQNFGKDLKTITNIDKLTYAGDRENNLDYENNPKYNFINGDICDQDLISSLLKEFDVDVIINFAAESHVDNSIESPDEFIQTNIFGTFNLLRCLQEFNSSLNKSAIILHVSTDEVFGSLKLNDPGFTEKNSYKPNSPYSASKASSDHLVQAWHKTYGLPTLITNCSNNYGPNQNFEKLIPKIIKCAVNKEEITIYGDGKNIRDWLYVDDHCKGIIKVLLEGKFGETYNIGGKNEISNIEIAKIICNLLENAYPFDKNPIKSNLYNSYEGLISFVSDRLGHDFRYSIDPSKIEKDLDWYPEETFETGITKTISWYLEKLIKND